MFLGWCCPMTILFFPRSGLKSPTRCVVFVPSSYKHLQATIGSYCHAGRNTDLVPYQRQILRILLVADFLRSVLQRGSYQLHAEYDTLNLRQRAKQEKKMRKKNQQEWWWNVEILQLCATLVRSTWLAFPFAPLGLEGFAYVVPCRQKGVYTHGVGLLSSVSASPVSIVPPF